MDLMLLSVIAITALALLFDFSNGFHDAANSIATVVATRAMAARWAVVFSAVCNFAAFFFVGSAVANTVAGTVKIGAESSAVVFAALFAALLWNYLTWNVGMPSSSSHALIGGLVGAGLSAAGTAAINWSSLRKTLIAIVASPAVAFAVAAVATVLVIGLQRLTRWSDDAKPFKGAQLISAAAVSYGHGANDAQKTMGVIAALLLGAGYAHKTPGVAGIPIPQWVAIAAYAAIAVGTMWGGWRIIETMGLRLTALNPRTGVAANIGATTAIFGATALGVPISTTHAAASSVVGAGVAARRGTRWRIVGEMVLAWIFTMPATAVISFLVFKLTRLPSVLSGISITVLLLIAGAWMIHAMRHTVTAKDLEAALPVAEESTPADATKHPLEAA